MTQPHASLWIVLGVALAVSVVTDLLRRRILDIVTLPALVLLLGLRLGLEGLGSAELGLLSGLLGALLAAVVFAIPAWRGNMGWGDVKLIAVVGAAFGFPAALGALVFISLVGALQAVLALVWAGEVWGTLVRVGRRSVSRVGQERRQIPYGLAIALGSAFTFVWQRTGGA